jgi:hydroxymethylpyrimidine pyrophosphatase-like HAD family hydrolase
MGEVMAALPELGFESYHDGAICVHNPNLVSWKHLERVGARYTVCERIEEMPTPWTKLILEQDHPVLVTAQKMFAEKWGHLYEAIFSNRYLLEVTAKNNTKGALVTKLAGMLGAKPEHIYCIGDNQNDIPMLAVSAIPFAPDNCSQEVRDWGARLVGHCDDDAVARVIEILDGIY